MIRVQSGNADDTDVEYIGSVGFMADEDDNSSTSSAVGYEAAEGNFGTLL